jgi:hypothetical protein
MATTTANPVNTAAVNAIGRCQLCGNMRQTTSVKFQRNIGMLVARQTRTLQANMCKTCLKQNFWRFQGLGLLLGPWGMISLVVTPIYLIANTAAFVSASKKLSGAIE